MLQTFQNEALFLRDQSSFLFDNQRASLAVVDAGVQGVDLFNVEFDHLLFLFIGLDSPEQDHGLEVVDVDLLLHNDYQPSAELDVMDLMALSGG